MIYRMCRVQRLLGDSEIGHFYAQQEPSPDLDSDQSSPLPLNVWVVLAQR